MKKEPKTTKKIKKSNLEKAQKKLDEFIELLKSSKEGMSESIKNDLEYLIKMCVLSGKISDVSKKKPTTTREMLAKYKEIEKMLAIQDSPMFRYDEKHVKKLMRLLDIDKKRAKELSEYAKRQHNLHVPYKENALDKTMMADCDIQEQCISSINGVRESAKEPFSMTKAIKSIDNGLKEIRKSYPGVINKWKITSDTLDKSDYIYVDVDFKTTLNTHRHIFKLSPTYFVSSAHFSDDTNAKTINVPNGIKCTKKSKRID